MNQKAKNQNNILLKILILTLEMQVATDPYITSGNVTGGGNTYGSTGYQAGGAQGMVGNTGTTQAGSRFTTGQREYAIDAEHVVIHLSLSEGLDNNYPFGNSLLRIYF